MHDLVLVVYGITTGFGTFGIYFLISDYTVQTKYATTL